MNPRAARAVALPCSSVAAALTASAAGGLPALTKAEEGPGALSDNLHTYLRDVFHQLDSGHSGAVTRADFETLCEILELDPSPALPPASSPGLSWLPSYHPRPGTPASPIRCSCHCLYS